jgi:hypothetical protein
MARSSTKFSHRYPESRLITGQGVCLVSRVRRVATRNATLNEFRAYGLLFEFDSLHFVALKRLKIKSSLFHDLYFFSLNLNSQIIDAYLMDSHLLVSIKFDNEVRRYESN